MMEFQMSNQWGSTCRYIKKALIPKLHMYSSKSCQRTLSMVPNTIMLLGFTCFQSKYVFTIQYLFFFFFSYRYINIIFFCCHWLAMSNSCYNPFIYGIFSVSAKVRLHSLKYVEVHISKCEICKEIYQA